MGSERPSATSAWLPVVGWAALLFGLSSIPGARIPSLSISYADKLAHACLYGVLGALAFRALVRRAGRPRSPAWSVLVAALIGLGYGVSDELHQIFVPGRSADPFDVLADLVGGAVGSLAAHAARGRVSQRS